MFLTTRFFLLCNIQKCTKAQTDLWPQLNIFF